MLATALNILFKQGQADKESYENTLKDGKAYVGHVYYIGRRAIVISECD